MTVLQGVNQVLQEALRCDSDSEVARVCLRVAEQITGSPFGLIGEINRRGKFDTIALSDPGWEACQIERGLAVRALRDMEIRGVLGRALLTGKSFYVNDLSKDPDSVGVPTGHPQIHCFLAVPLKHSDQTFGQIAVANRAGGYTAKQLADLEDLAVAFAEALERKRAELAQRLWQERYRIIFHAVTESLILSDPSGRIEEVNPTACSLFGVHATELKGKFLEEWIDPDFRKEFKQSLALLEKGEVVHGVSWVRRPDAARLAIDYCARPFIFAQEPHMLWVIRDITAEQRAVDLLRQARDELDERVRQRTDALSRAVEQLRQEIAVRKEVERGLAEAVEELKRSNADLEQFAYAASHDLQEPLRVIGGFADLLAHHYGEKLDSRAAEYLQFIRQGVQRMHQLIMGLLAFCKVGRRGEPLQPVDINQVLHEAQENLRASIEQSGAVITYDEPLPTVQGIHPQLVQVFQNLLANSIKFRGDQPPRLHVGIQRLPEAWKFCVEDNGIGIDPKSQPRIFQMFQRGGQARDRAGLGIGLAICKRIIEGHGGQIWVESQPGRGSRFYFTVPVREEAPVTFPIAEDRPAQAVRQKLQ